MFRLTEIFNVLADLLKPFSIEIAASSAHMLLHCRNISTFTKEIMNNQEKTMLASNVRRKLEPGND